ncbi:MAG: glycoside hydrolase family 3 C-terminal domain-containing protein [Tannerella sp.]|jgi:beta-glucosidase|nr:glycoside hydrolase family 3 C-terminal domain-containing protein [Tannerella sp.]
MKNRNTFKTLYAPLSILLLWISFLPSCKEKITYQFAFQNPALNIEERVEDLLGHLTVEEKVAQMMNATPAIERLGIPPYDWWNEALHGVARADKATVFPQAIALAATFDDEALFETFTIIGDEARAKYNDYQQNKAYDRYKGLTFWTPNINIFRDPRWGRGMETYGEDPCLTARMGLACVKGLQGDDPKYLKTQACAKHYAVHSGPEWNRHSFDVYVSPRDLYTTYLPAFETLVKEGNVQQVMCAYNRFEGQPCCGNNKLLVDILRNSWGYENIVVSDCGAIDDFWRKNRHLTHPDKESAAVAAVRTGTDLECGSSYTALLDAVKNGKITEEELNISLRRLFTGRMKLGMFDPQELLPYASIPYSIVECEEHVNKALEMARKSIVLLKNADNILPLDKNIVKIALTGPNAADSIMLWANYNGFPSHTVTILEGIKNKIPQAEIIYEKGCDHTGNIVHTDENDTIGAPVDFNATAAKVKDADVILFAGGLSPRLEGEEMPVQIDGFKKGDRTNIDLPQIQQDMLKILKQTGKPVIFILCTGSALALTDVNENADAILNAWYGGQTAGTAVADILFGDYNPSGKLPVTFYKSTGQLPDFEDYSMKGRTYRYMTEEPLYPFGYGLSYTTFEFGDAQLSSTVINKNETLKITIPVENTGETDGDETVQIYVKNPNDPAAPVKTLKTFERISIKAGSAETAELMLKPDAFYSFNDEKQTMETKAGKYQILYGNSSSDKNLKSVEITIKE